MILALETTEKFGSVALLDGKCVLAEILLPKDRRSSKTLHPALHTLFETTKIATQQIDTVAVVAGPGSFTGLRVGITAAKIFAYSTGAKVVALDSFLTIASALPPIEGVISVGVDAQRGEVVATLLRPSENAIEILKMPERIAVSDWWKHAEQYNDILFTGPAMERWKTNIPSTLRLAEEDYWFPKASIAGKLAAERIALGTLDDVWTLLPIYSRQSAAEERQA